MKKTFKLVLAILFLLTSFVGHAQIISAKNIKNRLIHRAGQRAEEKATQKVEEGIDKVFDSLFGTPAQKKETTRSSDSVNAKSSDEAALGMISKMMSSFGTSEAPNSNYNFTSSYVMNMHSKTKDEDLKMKTKYYFTESGKYMGTKILEGNHPQMNSSTDSMEAMIMDFEKKSMYTFLTTDGKKVMMGISLNSTLGIAEVSSSEAMENKLTKTGETKTIAGYATDAFLLTQGEDKSTIWISRSSVPVVSTYYEAFQKMSSSGNSFLSANTSRNAQMMAFAKEGRTMLGMYSKTKDGDEMTMEVENIQASDPFSFSTSGYENMMDINKIMQDTMKEGAKD